MTDFEAWYAGSGMPQLSSEYVDTLKGTCRVAWDAALIRHSCEQISPAQESCMTGDRFRELQDIAINGKVK